MRNQNDSDSGTQPVENAKQVGPHSGSYPARPRDSDAREPTGDANEAGEQKPKLTDVVIGWVMIGGIVAAIFFGIRACGSDVPDTSAQSSTAQMQESDEPAAGPLARPTSFRVTKTRTTLHLEWSHQGGASTYRVQSGTIDKVAQTRSFTIGNLRAGTTYEVRVRAEAGSRKSAWTVIRADTKPPAALPDNVSYLINERYDDIDPLLFERVLADIVDWYRQQYGLVAVTQSLIAVEPQCNPNSFTEALGFARRTTDEDGASLIEVCVRLDEDSDSAIEADEFKWLLAHEFFHVLQANAGWAFEDSESIFGIQGECGRFLTEGSAEYFGQLYAWGELQGGGILDTLSALFGGDAERWYYYEEGSRAFEELIQWKGHETATSFWESEEQRCSDAFLAAFDVAPGKYESDWRTLTSR